jgi:signal transduction histidine kinase
MKYSILIIDDDQAFRKLLELRLKVFLKTIEVTTFDNLASAREYLSTSNQTFDLVLLDEHLPDGRGSKFLAENIFEGLAVLSLSSDDAPEIPGALVQAGAAYFLNKTQVSEPLFKPLVLGIIDRNKLKLQLEKAKIDSAVIETVKTLVGTLRHEINNPLGAVLGAAYLLRTDRGDAEDLKEAAELVESSGKRIKHVLDKLCEAVALESVTKANHKVFHIPGDKPWESEEKKKR